MKAKATHAAKSIKTKDDTDELALLESFEAGEWAAVSDEAADIARYRSAASKALLKNKRVNIRLSSMDLEGLQAKAAQEGLPYQTLIASVLHKYVSGRLVNAQI
jgi:predicted DNA binding CopG/RHH family protein